MLSMSFLIIRLLLYLAAWTAVVSAFYFTSSFSDWVGNTTYTVTWNSSSSDPNWYDLTLARPHDVNAAGVDIDDSWPMDWSVNVATHVSSNGNHAVQFTLPPSCWPGAYYWILQADKNIPVSQTFFISSSETSSATIPTYTAFEGGEPTTISSLVPITLTQSMVGTSAGHLVTLKPSDVFTSEFVYTTIIVTGQGGNGTPPGKVHMIIGVTLAALFLIIAPIIVWLVLRYRRRPIRALNSASGSDKHLPPDPEVLPGSSTLDLLEPNTPEVNLTLSDPMSTEAARQVWAIVDGEKQLVTVPRYPPRAASPVEDADPFADPIIHERPGAHLRLQIPGNIPRSNISPPSSTTTPVYILSPGNTTTSHTTLNTTHQYHGTSVETHTGPASDAARLAEKISRMGRHRAAPEPQPLSPEDVAARIFVPGRAIDMGPLRRDRMGDVDENGLLPPDYFQATQPIPSQRPPQTGPRVQ